MFAEKTTLQEINRSAMAEECHVTKKNVSYECVMLPLKKGKKLAEQISQLLCLSLVPVRSVCSHALGQSAGQQPARRRVSVTGSHCSRGPSGTAASSTPMRCRGRVWIMSRRCGPPSALLLLLYEFSYEKPDFGCHPPLCEDCGDDCAAHSSVAARPASSSRACCRRASSRA